MKKFGLNNHQDGNRFFKEKPQLFEAVCANCGKSCQIPFKPTGERPVYCDDCYENVKERDGGQRVGRGNAPRRDFRGRDGGRRDFHDRGSERKEMFDAVCDNCGRDCQVPFKPTGEKPVYCSDCFEKNGGKSAGRSDSRDFKRNDMRSSGITSEQFSQLSVKLDKILKLLEPKMPELITEKPKEISLEDKEKINELIEIPVTAALKPKVVKKTVAKKEETKEEEKEVEELR